MNVKKLINERGLTLVEMMVVLVLLNIVLAVGYTFFFFGTRTFAEGEKQSDIQQNVRMAADQIAKELRFAESVLIMGNSATFSTDSNYFYTQSNNIMFRAKGDTVGTELLETISQKVAFTVTYKRNATKANILDLTVTGTSGGKSYTITTELLLPNSDIAIDTDSGATTSGGGMVVQYATPKPPDPAFQYVTMTPMEQTTNDSITLDIDLLTANVVNGMKVNAKLYEIIATYDNTDPTIVIHSTSLDNTYYIHNNAVSDIQLIVPDSLAAGEYKVRIDIESVLYPYIMTYVIRVP